MKAALKYGLFRLREKIRMTPAVSISLYMAGNLRSAFFGRCLRLRLPANARPHGVAVCLRFRDEARFLDEWLRYYRAAGIAHFFLYNNFSEDGFDDILAPHCAAGYVTLIDWPHSPASPAAEEDCIARTIGRYEWVGFLDADEFVVVKDSRSIPEFLSGFPRAPGVALHWFYFGSNGHETRPNLPVIEAYTRRQSDPDVHVKCFVRPDAVSQNRNPHCWFFRGARWAVDETGHGLYGSIGTPRTARAWINHYYCKSLADYLEKAGRQQTHDANGIRNNTRREKWALKAMRESNDVDDRSAVIYRDARLAAVQAG